MQSFRTSPSEQTRQDITPEKALELLRDGNARFCANLRASRDYLGQVEETRDGQWPFAAVLGCIDSRVPAEVVFDQGLGDLFNLRVAGNFINEDGLGSLEFACKVAGARLIVVLGHSRCGAVMGACDNVELGNITAMLKKIEPAVKHTAEPTDAAQRNSKNADFVQAVVENNVELTVQAIRDRSEILSEMEQEGSIKIVGAVYDVRSGHVEWLAPAS